MIFPPGTLLDPRLQGRDLLLRERLRLSFGRHPLVVVIGGDPLPGERALQVSRCDHVLALALGEGLVLQIEAKLSLARRLVGPVALEAMLRQDRADLFQEADGAILGAAARAVLSLAKAPLNRSKPRAKARTASINAPAPMSHRRWMKIRMAKPHWADLYGRR